MVAIVAGVYLAAALSRSGVIDSGPTHAALDVFSVSALLLLFTTTSFLYARAQILFTATPEKLVIGSSMRSINREFMRGDIAGVRMVVHAGAITTEPAIVHLNLKSGTVHDLGHGSIEECTALAKAIARGLKLRTDVARTQ